MSTEEGWGGEQTPSCLFVRSEIGWKGSDRQTTPEFIRIIDFFVLWIWLLAAVLMLAVFRSQITRRSLSQFSPILRPMYIRVIPVLADNYSYLIVDEKSKVFRDLSAHYKGVELKMGVRLRLLWIQRIPISCWRQLKRRA
jgi:hypothetical protein